MSKALATLVSLTLFLFTAALSAEIVNQDLWINEFHYDNAAGDTGEFVEIAVPEGTVVTGLLLEFYNGSGGGTYGSVAGSSWTFGSTTNGFSFFTVNFAGIQNGAPDGLALSSADGSTLYQFLSYEGTLLATNGNWAGSTSTDIGVSESGSTAVGDSLQLSGTGSMYSDFAWAAAAPNTAGAINSGQTAIPEPSSLVICLVGCLLTCRRRKRT